MAQTDCGEISRQACSFASAKLFGSFQFKAPGGDDIVISNRRARALLAMLCLTKGEAMDREHLSKLLWPGRFEAHSRASLRQCVLDLGKVLAPWGPDMLDVARTTIALKPGSIQTDLDDLEHALARGDHASATGQLIVIGTKPILDQMDFGDAFNQWLAKQRAAVAKRLNVTGAALVPATASPCDTIRIAVLPFQAIDAREGQGYFADGVVDELITALSQVPQLLVAGRTSSFHFRDSALAPPEIAATLHVSHLIEGSVQRQDEQVRIHVRLVDGETGFEKWSKRYDGTLDNIFALQEVVAQAVTAAISSALGIILQPPLVHGMTHSKAAYDLYLQGRALNTRVFGDGVLACAIDLLEQAVALDPQFAEAWLLLGDVHQRTGLYMTGIDLVAAAARMAECVRKSLEIKPDLGQAYSLLSLHQLTQNNFVGALDLAFKGYQMEPQNPVVAVRLGTSLLFCGRTRDGMRYINEAIDQDPVDGRHYMCRSAGHLNLGNISAAIADGQRTVDLGFPSMWLGVATAAAGDHDLAVEQYQQTRLLLNKSIPPPDGMAPMSAEVMDAYWLVAAQGVCGGSAEERETYCHTLDFLHMTMHEKEHLAITLPAVFMGYADMLFKTLGERISLSNLACMMSIWADIDPIRRIWQHPEFIPFAQHIGMAAVWEKYGWPDLLPPPSNRRVN
jgi:TolB-like protein